MPSAGYDHRKKKGERASLRSRPFASELEEKKKVSSFGADAAALLHICVRSTKRGKERPSFP